VKELIALLKANPGKYSYGSSGMGSILHLCGEQFKTAAGGLQAVHVPYRGSAPMMADLVGGQIALAFDALPTVLPQVQAGKIRAIGGGMATRARAMPELPTLQEQGVSGFECYTWNAILAPAKTPAPIVALLSGAINKSLADPTILKRLQGRRRRSDTRRNAGEARRVHQVGAREMGADHQGVRGARGLTEPIRKLPAASRESAVPFPGSHWIMPRLKRGIARPGDRFGPDHGYSGLILAVRTMAAHFRSSLLM
jgi:hypothetical protein